MKEKLLNCKIIIEIELIDKIVGGNQFYEIYFTATNKEKYKISKHLYLCMWYREREREKERYRDRDRERYRDRDRQKDLTK